MSARNARLATLVLLVALSTTLIACSTEEPASEEPAQTPSNSEPMGMDGSAGGSRLAAGLYDIQDGKSQAIGTLEYRDLEGGFWAVVGGGDSNGGPGMIVAVIANGADFQTEFEALKGRTVSVIGIRLEGPSIRMAGPEIQAESFEELDDTPGPAE